MTDLKQYTCPLVPGGEIVTVDAASLDRRGAHLLWRAAPSAALRASWGLFGQLAPVLVDFAAAWPLLVTGHARAELALELGAPLLALSVKGHGPYADGGQALDPLELGLAYVAANLERAVAQEGFESRLLAAARYFAAHGPDTAWLEPLAALYGRDARDRLFAWLGDWLSLPSDMDPLVHAGRLGLALGSELSTLDRDDLAALAPFLGLASWPKKLAADLVSWLRQTALRQGQSVAELCKKLGLARLEGSPNDIQRLARLAVRGARFPSLSELEERFAKLSRRLDPKGRLRLAPDQGFETGRLGLSPVVASRADLGQLIDILSASLDDPAWDALWRLADVD